MSHIGELGDIKRPLSGWLSLVLFVLMIPLTNWAGHYEYHPCGAGVFSADLAETGIGRFPYP